MWRAPLVSSAVGGSCEVGGTANVTVKEPLLAGLKGGALTLRRLPGGSLSLLPQSEKCFRVGPGVRAWLARGQPQLPVPLSAAPSRRSISALQLLSCSLATCTFPEQ